MKSKEGNEIKYQITELLNMCNSQKVTPTTFLRKVQTAPELILVLALIRL